MATPEVKVKHTDAEKKTTSSTGEIVIFLLAYIFSHGCTCHFSSQFACGLENISLLVYLTLPLKNSQVNMRPNNPNPLERKGTL